MNEPREQDSFDLLIKHWVVVVGALFAITMWISFKMTLRYYRVFDFDPVPFLEFTDYPKIFLIQLEWLDVATKMVLIYPCYYLIVSAARLFKSKRNRLISELIASFLLLVAVSLTIIPPLFGSTALAYKKGSFDHGQQVTVVTNIGEITCVNVIGGSSKFLFLLDRVAHPYRVITVKVSEIRLVRNEICEITSSAENSS